MIPLYKLERLPRPLRLRKAERLFAAAELSLSGGAIEAPEGSPLDTDQAAYLGELAAFLAADEAIPAAAKEALNEAAAVLAAAASRDASGLVRAVNTARHVLLAETGRSAADWDMVDHSGALEAGRRRPFAGMEVYLEDIRSPFNVGAMFRSAECFGVEKALLSPLCADPRHPRALRTAMGCVDILPWERADLAAAAVGIPMFALESGGLPPAEFPFPRRGIMAVGSEELGVSPRALALADASLGRLSIPMRGAKGSLNVSAAFAAALFAWTERLARQA